ncbi:MAG: diguanylate cyclase [Pseudomonadota bacterium]
MTHSNLEFQEKLRLLAVSFAESLPLRIKEMESMWQQLQTEWDKEDLQALHRAVHGLTGSGKIFGFPEVSVIALALEQHLKELIQRGIIADPQKSNQIQEQIAELQRTASSTKLNFTQKIVTPSHDDAMASVSMSADHLFVVDEDIEAAQELALQLRYYGYEVEVFNELSGFQSALKNNPNAIILMNVEFHEDRSGGIKIIKEIQKNLSQSVRVIFISVHDDLASRLDAVRAGSIAYFTKPINSAELIDQIDSLTTTQTQEPYRVLIVEDSPATLAYHAALLQHADMKVKTESRPLKVIETLLEFNPDLILMDMYMPECSGIELAKVIRQFGSFVSTPIVYLSSENDFNTQLEAMSLSGDDFLVKPIEPQQLIFSVTQRINRFRLLRSFMVHDGLTGLLNHTAIKEQLTREVVRSTRLKSPLSFAMIDIDFFKKVNDTYGHAAGDRVLKSLARLLKQRLRETDIVGRYGGEEFAIIMTDTDALSASKVIDEIRIVFSRVLHLSEDNEFSVSFSCGIADINHFATAVSLSEAADKALYQAKQRGRNKVVVNADD